MPFIGETLSVKVTPEEVGDGSVVKCPSCGRDMKPRKAHHREGSFVARHFYHVSDPDCDGSTPTGESATHQKMKSIATSKAKQKWPDATVTIEEPVKDRRADVLVEFPNHHRRYGEGVAIEVQHKNESKEIGNVTADFITEGYSCLWLWEEQFSKRDVDFSQGDWKVYWAHQVPCTDEWGGYSGVVQWLWQEKPSKAEVEVVFPVAGSELVSENLLRRSWFSGFKQSFENPQSMGVRSQRHEDTESEWVDIFRRNFNHGRTKKWLKIVESPTGNLCIQIAKTTSTGVDSTMIQVSESDFKKFVDFVAVLGDIMARGSRNDAEHGGGDGEQSMAGVEINAEDECVVHEE